MRKSNWINILILFACVSVGMANTAPQVTNVTAIPQTDDSGIVDISYTLIDADGDACTISVLVSNDGGAIWEITPQVSALSGDVGEKKILPGRRHIEWRSKVDLPGAYDTRYKVKVIGDDGVADESTIDMVFVLINDPGISGHEGFNGEMSKYETTNAQYCQYLNAALSAGLIAVYMDVVYAASDTGHVQPYFETYAKDGDSQITYSGGSFRVRNRDGYTMVNHPVVEVSWFGATAFCVYYGYRLPTEWEWQAVADYNGSYTYACGATINYSNANYSDRNPLDLVSYPHTSPVNNYPAYGYGLHDMTGNVEEFTTNSYPNEEFRVIRGGKWSTLLNQLRVSERKYNRMNTTNGLIGFRVCR
ncbi:formylglycine-generating enzyme family protein [Planctomycetota bacterium]